MSRRATALSCAVALVVCLFALVLVGGRTPPRPPGVAEQAGSGVTCADVLVVGIDGNGERPGPGHRFGRTVDSVTRVYASRLASTRSVRTLRIGGWTPPLAVLTRGALPHRGARTAVRTASVRRWMAPVPDAVDRAAPRIAGLLRTCPSQQLVLVGYAQGAAIVHRVLLRLAGGGLGDRVTGAALISDPYRPARTVATVDGDPTAPHGRAGIGSLRLRGIDDVPAPHGTYHAWEVCTRGDLVCDPSVLAVRASAAIASSYVVPRRADPVVRRTRGRLVAGSLTWPVPADREQLVRGTTGHPLNVQLSASGGGGDVVWTPVGPLPAGLSLSAGGLLSGTPAKAGLSTITVGVAGADPATPSATGRIVLTITGDVVALSSGGQTTCETRSDGTAQCWGRNDYGQFGNGTRTGGTAPTAVAGTRWAQISTSGSTTCGVRLDHALFCWGLNNYGQTGHARSGPITTPKRVGTATSWRQVAVGWSHACAVRLNGQLACWGQNLRGQLGIASTGGVRSAPTQVAGGGSWSSVAVGGWHTCGIRTDGSAWCWGDNDFGALGDGTTTRRDRPVRVAGGLTWRDLSVGWGTVCGLTTAQDLACWGRNRNGEIGDGTTTAHLTPYRVGDGRLWLSVAAGEGSTCAVDASGIPVCWGENRYGQTATSSASTVRTPTARAQYTGMTQVAAGWLSYCGLGSTTDCWGNAEAGTLGGTSPRIAPRLSPRTSTRPGIPLAEQRRLDTMSPAEVAQHDLAARPVVTARAVRRSTTATTPFRVMTENVLGSNHTAPGSDAQEYAPARLRAEWETGLIQQYRPSLLGTQEAQPDQIGDFTTTLGSTYSIYPGAAQGYQATPQSLMFRSATWTQVWRTSISIPFVGGWRPQPIVRLSNSATGAEVYFINVHFAPGSMQDARRKAMNVLVAEIRTLLKDKLPIVLTGDFNEKAWVYCQITGRTPLRAASGGSNNGTCRPPKRMRVDWLFGWRGTWSAYGLSDGTEVNRTSDHAIQYATFTVG